MLPKISGLIYNVTGIQTINYKTQVKCLIKTIKAGICKVLTVSGTVLKALFSPYNLVIALIL